MMKELYINALDIVGHDRTGRPGKFIYDYGNGESKKLSINIVDLLSLFSENYRDWS